MIKKLKTWFTFHFINFWHSFLGAGIVVERISKDFLEIDVKLKRRFWNRNYVGTAYGGSLYSMTDPFYMLMLIQNLGHDYIVWDKAASIEFKKPGTSEVYAKFRLTPSQIESYKQQLEVERKIEPVLVVDILGKDGEVVAQVHKKLYMKKK